MNGHRHSNTDHSRVCVVCYLKHLLHCHPIFVDVTVLIAFIAFGIIYFLSINKSSMSDGTVGDVVRVNGITSQIHIQTLYEEIKKLKSSLNLSSINAFSNELDMRIEKALDLYGADKTGMFDYAAEYAGGLIVSTPGTTPFPIYKCVTFLNALSWDSNSQPRNMIQPSMYPGDCFAFYGNKGRIWMKLAKKISITAVSLEHSNIVQDKNKSSAPKKFQVFGLQNPDESNNELLGSFEYDLNGHSVQTFQITAQNNQFEYVELRIASNHGNDQYTCVYRFRVHSK